MKRRTRAAWAAGATAAAVAASISAGVAVHAAEITGETTVTLDVTTSGQVSVTVWARNDSAVPAYGAAVVEAPDGSVTRFGPRLFAPGEEWVYETTLTGYGCADVGRATAAAFGWEQLGTAPDWTSGVVRTPDPRVTVLGCDTPPPTPTPTATPTATVTPSASATASSAGIPGASPSPTPGTGLAATGGDGAVLAPIALAAAGLVVVGAALGLRRGRARSDA